jgi:hypothetical protein
MGVLQDSDLSQARVALLLAWDHLREWVRLSIYRDMIALTFAQVPHQACQRQVRLLLQVYSKPTVLRVVDRVDSRPAFKALRTCQTSTSPRLLFD